LLTTHPAYLQSSPVILSDYTSCSNVVGSQCIQRYTIIIDPKRSDPNDTICDVSGAYVITYNVTCRTNINATECDLINHEPEPALVAAKIHTEDFCYVLRFGVGLIVDVQTYVEYNNSVFSNPKNDFFVNQRIYVRINLGAINGFILGASLGYAGLTDGTITYFLYFNNATTSQYGVPINFEIIPTGSPTSVAFAFDFTEPLPLPQEDSYSSFILEVMLNVDVVSFSKKREIFKEDLCCTLKQNKEGYSQILVGPRNLLTADASTIFNLSKLFAIFAPLFILFL